MITITKISDEQHIVMGWANVANRADGTVIEDFQQDIIEPEVLEKAAYDFVLNFRNTGELHNPDLREKGKLVESVIFTKEKMTAMGIPENTIPEGWWVGFKIEDDNTWERVKKGNYKMFSIEGAGDREPVQKQNNSAKTFKQFYRGDKCGQ